MKLFLTFSLWKHTQMKSFYKIENQNARLNFSRQSSLKAPPQVRSFLGGLIDGKKDKAEKFN